MAAKSKPNEISITRVYDAPVKAVWDAWVDPEQVGKWWGPRGFTLTTQQKDVRPGGTWTYTMHGPDGVDYPNKTVFHEVEKYSRLVYDHGANDSQPALFRVTVNFSEHKGRTTMEMTMACVSAEAATETKKFIKKAGGNSTWDRLAEFLEQGQSGKQKFVINRSFETSVEQMFKVWTDPKHVARWMPPTGFKMEFLRAEIKPGGSSFYRMYNDQGMTMYGKCEYIDIHAPDRVVYRQAFCDEHEKLSRHPMAPTWPEWMRTQIDLIDEGHGQTRVTVTWECDGQVKPEELAAFIKERGGMTQGWTGSFDKLEDYLGTL